MTTVFIKVLEPLIKSICIEDQVVSEVGVHVRVHVLPALKTSAPVGVLGFTPEADRGAVVAAWQLAVFKQST